MEDDDRTADELQAELDDEGELWDALGISVEMSTHTNGSLFLFKQEQQAILNVLFKTGVLDEDEVNCEFKRILLNTMTAMREEFESKKKQARLDDIMGRPGKIMLPDGMRKPGGGEAKF